MMRLNELPITDGKILKLEGSIETLTLIFQDWQAQQWRIIFTDALAIQSFNVGGEDLDRLEISKDSAFKDKTMSYFSDEESDEFYCYRIFGVWSERAIVEIIANNSYLIEKI